MWLLIEITEFIDVNIDFHITKETRIGCKNVFFGAAVVTNIVFVAIFLLS